MKRDLNQHIIQNVFNQFDEIRSNQKVINDTIEKAWDIIRTLSPQSVPDKNEDNSLSKKEVTKFSDSIRKIKREFDYLYDKCPFDDNDEITTEIGSIRIMIINLLNKLEQIILDAD